MKNNSSSTIVYVESVAREIRDHLPPLIVDARENPLYVKNTPEGKVIVKNVAYPYIGNHLLVIPDQTSQQDMPGVTHVPPQLLSESFRTAAELAEFYQNREDVQEIDIGFNYSEYEPTKIVASQRKNLHIHVLGFTEKDMAKRMELNAARKRPEFKNQMREPLESVVDEIIMREVFEPFQKEDTFQDLFISAPNASRPTFYLKKGLESIRDEQFSDIIQRLHTRALEVYNELARCFFAWDQETGSFTEEENRTPHAIYTRYKMLGDQERRTSLEAYFERHPELSPKSRQLLTYLSNKAQPVGNLIEKKAKENTAPLSPEEEKKMLLRLMPIKNLAYACVVSGTKAEGHYEWKLGFDVDVFSQRDVLQASRGEPKLFTRDSQSTYSPELLAETKKIERHIQSFLQK